MYSKINVFISYAIYYIDWRVWKLVLRGKTIMEMNIVRLREKCI